MMMLVISSSVNQMQVKWLNQLVSEGRNTYCIAKISFLKKQ